MPTPQPEPDQVPDGAPEPLPLIDPRVIPPEKQDEFVKAAVKRRKDDVEAPAGQKVQVLVEGVTSGGKEVLDPVFEKFAVEPTAEERKAFAVGAEKEAEKPKTSTPSSVSGNR